MTHNDLLLAVLSRPLSSLRFAAMLLIAGVGVGLDPDEAWALQSHGPPEGLYAHQMAHVLFAISMAVLAYWLEANRFTEERGWRLIQLSCLLFFLWNLVALAGHFVEVRIPPDLIEGQGSGWDQRLLAGGGSYALFYYFLKMDHFVCVPAILCLFFGIRNLYKQTLMKAAQDK